VLGAAEFAYRGFNALISDDDDEYILADTGDDSEGSIDPELGPADYWCCLKCKNPSNTPMYSFCERCFQVSPHLLISRPAVVSIKKIDNREKAKHVETCSRLRFVSLFDDVTALGDLFSSLFR
jgi:hypothetical protein